MRLDFKQLRVRFAFHEVVLKKIKHAFCLYNLMLQQQTKTNKKE